MNIIEFHLKDYLKEPEEYKFLGRRMENARRHDNEVVLVSPVGLWIIHGFPRGIQTTTPEGEPLSLPWTGLRNTLYTNAWDALEKRNGYFIDEEHQEAHPITEEK